MAGPVQNNIFDIVLDTEVDNTGAISAAIDWLSPDGVSGSWGASVNQNLLTYTTQVGDIHIHGTWTLQAYVVAANGEVCHGTPVEVYISKLIRGSDDAHP